MDIDSRKWRKIYREVFPWNEAQLFLFDIASNWGSPLLSNGKEAIAVEAVAGAGKTTTIYGLVAALPSSYKIAIAAFNVHIAEKIKNDKRIPKGRVSVSTAHSFGLGLLCARFGRENLIVDKAKYSKLIKSNIIQELFKLQQEFRSDRDNLSSKDIEEKWLFPPPFYDERTKQGKAKFNGFIRLIVKICSMARKSLCPQNFQSLLDMVNYYGLEDEFAPAEVIYGIVLALKAMDFAEKTFPENGTIDFDDMLYLPWKLGLKPAEKNCLIVDEAQDANAAMLALYESYVCQGAKIIYIGDRSQAIMGFTGAGVDSWQRLEERFGGIKVGLDITYRCPRSHVALASKVVERIMAWDEKGEGAIEVALLSRALEKVKAGDLLICRVNFPLIAVCLKLIKQGLRAVVRGRDISVRLIALAVRAVDNQIDFWPGNFINLLNIYVEKQVRLLQENEDFESIERLVDLQFCLQYFWKELAQSYDTFDSFCDAVKNYFVEDKNDLSEADEGNDLISISKRSSKSKSLVKSESKVVIDNSKNLVVLSSIHRAKGDEANRVFILGSNLLPFSYKNQKDWQLQQEYNVLYVALTRAKEELFLVPLNQWDVDDEESVKRGLAHPYGGIGFPQETSAQEE